MSSAQRVAFFFVELLMQIFIDNSFGRDAKKLPDSVVAELNEIYKALEAAHSLGEVVYDIKKIEGHRKRKAFRLKLEKNREYRIGFYLEGESIVLSRILHRRDIYNSFPPKK
ncbi:type II toxin-antitoxin system RelE/ParE family toxin [Larkinella terrae]|uniref:Type II toxin-antitoxin system RelE/ParE family toxin n=1 Tax=Larkinella terrae TaxID=2025311 RepID=A0A7K0EIM8_9BACT|nr:type II toxin-antitoxin system RelE/ParE family toxin [Larkinella terrae]MRS61605.1 type II toxin-antitoxin system RelE/ParE family toxin [Larkinella terrae]